MNPQGMAKASGTLDATAPAAMEGMKPGKAPFLQRGCIEADPFVMWVAVTFVTIITVLYFFLRGVKRPTSRDRK